MKLYLVAGEPSGDKLGAALMVGLKQLAPDVEFRGVGGPLMQAEGLESLFPMDELSVMGLAEVLPKLRHLFARRDETVADILRQDPDCLITIDSPDFCLRVASKLKAQRNIPCIHYVAPTVWAWRPKRAAKMARFMDHVLALFPFEPPYMQEAGMGCDFVGHPVVREPLASDSDVAAFREAYGLGEGPVILALPGSRRSEVTRLGPRFAEALEIVCARHPKAKIVVPTVVGVADLIAAQLPDWPGAPVLLDPRGMDAADFATQKRAAFLAADVALAASGTVSLELAANATPMVIAYDMNWFSRILMKRLLKTDTVTLVNLVSQTRVVPEYLGADCKPEKIAAGLMDLLEDGTARQAQIDASAICMKRLGAGQDDPGLRAAGVVLKVLGAPQVD